jgi:hypothetical protein
MSSTSDQLARKSARIAYAKAIEGGAAPYVAFDVACAAYRVYVPTTHPQILRSIVARCLAEQGVGGWTSDDPPATPAAGSQ